MPTLADSTEEDFAQAIAFGFTPVAAAEELGMNTTKIESIRLSNRSDIKERIREVVESQLFDTANEHIRVAQQLEMDRQFAYELGQPAAAINASVQRAKLLGIFIERTESVARVAVSSNKELSDDEWAKEYGEEKDHDE